MGFLYSFVNLGQFNLQYIRYFFYKSFFFYLLLSFFYFLECEVLFKGS